MKMGLYAIFDILAEDLGPLFEAKNHAVAIRAFKSVKVNDPNEFELVHLGYYYHEFDRSGKEKTKNEFFPHPVTVEFAKDYSDGDENG